MGRLLRQFVRALVLCLAVAVVAAILFAVAMRAQSQALGAALLGALPELTRTSARQTHVDPPRDGAFADALAPALSDLRKSRDLALSEKPEVSTLRRAIADGDKPLADLPAPWPEALSAGREPMRRAFAASRARTAGLPAGMLPLAERSVPLAQDGFGLVIHAAKLGALNLREHLDRGEVAEALDECLDGLGLARDLGHDSALMGRMVGAAVTNLLFQPCAHALDRAAPDRLASLRDALDSIRLNSPPIADVLRRDWIATQVEIFGASAPDDILAKLPSLARTGPYGARSNDQFAWVQRAILRQAWSTWAEQMARVLAAARGPRAGLRAAVAQMDEEQRESKNPVLYVVAAPYAKYIDRHDDALAVLTVLRAAAEARRLHAAGPWPKTVSEVLPAALDGVDPTAVTLEPKPDGLVLGLKLRAPLAGQPEAISTQLH